MLIATDELFCEQVGHNFKITRRSENRFGVPELCNGNLRYVTDVKQ